MSEIGVKNQLGYYWVSESSTVLAIRIRLSYQVEWNNIMVGLLGVPSIPDPVLEGITSLAEVMQLIPSFVGKGAELCDESKTAHVVGQNFKLNTITGFTKVDELPYALASVISLGVPSFYEATAFYVALTEDVDSPPATPAGFTRFDNVDSRGGTVLLPNKEELYLQDYTCMACNQNTPSTAADLSTCLPAFEGIEMESLSRPHILLDYVNWGTNNWLQRYAEIHFRGPANNRTVGIRKYTYHNYSVTDTLEFKEWVGPDFTYYANILPDSAPPSKSTPWAPWMIPGIWIQSEGEPFETLTEKAQSGLVYPIEGEGVDTVLLGDETWDSIVLPQGTMQMIS